MEIRRGIVEGRLVMWRVSKLGLGGRGRWREVGIRWEEVYLNSQWTDGFQW